MNETNEAPEVADLEPDTAAADGGTEEAPPVKPKKAPAKKRKAVKDQWADGGDIPIGASGPTAAKVMAAFELEGDKLTRDARSRIRRFQSLNGLTVNGRIDAPTRKILGI